MQISVFFLSLPEGLKLLAIMLLFNWFPFYLGYNDTTVVFEGNMKVVYYKLLTQNESTLQNLRHMPQLEHICDGDSTFDKAV